MIEQNVYIVGNGSLGSFTALLLSKIAWEFPWRMVLIDFDSVEDDNLINQLYRTTDVKQSKPNALREILLQFTPHLSVDTSSTRVDAGFLFQGIVVVLVDTMHARREIFDACAFNAAVPFYIEARSGGTAAIVHALDPRNPDSVHRYEKMLHSDESGIPAPCADALTTPMLYMVGAVIGRLLVRYEKSLIPGNELVQIVLGLGEEDDLPTLSSITYTGMSI